MSIYLHFERSTLNPTGLLNPPVNIVRLIFSSGPNQANISWNKDKETFETFKKMLLQIPSSQRSYDATTHIWTIKADKFNLIVSLFTPVNTREHGPNSLYPGRATLANFIQNCQTRSNRFNGAYGNTVFDRETKAPNAEDFFYNKSQPVSSTQMPLEQVRTKLFDLIGAPAQPSISYANTNPSVSKDIDIKTLTKLYRQAALKYHPDRNNGDATQMSQLNMLWQQYKSMIGA
jgi:hypothetical protein